MEIKDFLEQKLKTRASYKLTPKDQRKIKTDLSEFIMDRLLSGKFRNNKVDKVTLENTQKKVKGAIKDSQPLKFTFPFGGYKLFRLDTSPNPDWAEFFTMAYYADYMNQISQYYEPGCEFSFSSDEVIINRLDNISQADIDSYTQNFQKLVNIFNKHLPKNTKFKLQLVRNLYTSIEELEAELESNLEQTKDNWLFLPEDKKSFFKQVMELNINLNGEKDLTGKNLEDVMKKSMAYHDAYLKLKKRAEFVRGPDKIVIFTKTIPDSIPLGSTNYSAVKFWTGVGALEKDGESYKDLILSPSQLEANSFEVVPVDLKELGGLPNFDVVRLCQ